MRAPSWCTRVVRIEEQRGKVLVVITVAGFAKGLPSSGLATFSRCGRRRGTCMSVVVSIFLGVPRFLPSVAA